MYVYIDKIFIVKYFNFLEVFGLYRGCKSIGYGREK